MAGRVPRNGGAQRAARAQARTRIARVARRLGQAAAPPEHLVFRRVVNLDNLGANLNVEIININGNKFIFNLFLISRRQ